MSLGVCLETKNTWMSLTVGIDDMFFIKINRGTVVCIALTPYIPSSSKKNVKKKKKNPSPAVS